AAVEPAQPEVSPVSSSKDAGSRRLIPAAPSVRRFARELGVDITQIQGTGPGGRISMEDVKAYVREGQLRQETVSVAVTPQALAPVPVQLPDFSAWGPVERKPMSGVRRATARQTAGAWMRIPHVTHYDRADITELE